MERPLRKAEYTIHIEVPPNPFWASVGSVSYTHLDVYKRQICICYADNAFFLTAANAFATGGRLITIKVATASGTR